uniref:Uncharacterized protein n=1 Tax=Panagrolaimus davidi TaxID=227884 RepID=A0A914PCX6_9BILA
MYRIHERSGLSLDHQEFTCFDKRTLEEKFWEEEYKRFVAAIKCEDDMVQSFQNLDISNASGDKSDLPPTEDESAVNNNKEEEIRLEVQTMHAISDTVCYADLNAIDLANPCYKFLLNDELSATKNSISSPTAISSLIPKIIECKLETLKIYKQCLSLSEYNFLTASGTVLCLTLYSCTIEDDAGNVVTVDKLFDNLQLIHTFDMHCSNNSSWFELDTVKKMVRIISRFRKLQCLGFHGLTETFDISSFTDFVLQNSSIDIRLSFNVQLSAACKKLIVNFIDKILRNKPKKVPRLQFPSSAEDSKFAEYDKLYRRQK